MVSYLRIMQSLPSKIRSGAIGFCAVVILGVMSIAHSAGDPWILETNQLPNEEHLRATIANGYIGSIVYHGNLHVTGFYNGVANATTYDDTSTHCRVPNPIAFRLNIPHQMAAKSKFQLNLFDGVFIEEIDTGNWKIRIRQYAHQIYKTLLVVDVSGKPKISNPNDLKMEVEQLALNETEIKDMRILEKQSMHGISLIKYQPLIQEDPNTASPNLTIISTDLPNELLFTETGDTKWTYIMAALVNSDDTQTYKDLQTGLMMATQDALFKQHAEAWRRLWNEGGRLDVKGDNDLSQTVHAALYYLLSSSPTDPYDQNTVHGWPHFGLSPASLAHSDEEDRHYFGHIFWDQETWMLSALTPFQPNVIKRILIDSRIRRLDGAKRKANLAGLGGVMFPWEVGYSGVETTNWEPAANREIHITGDIAQFARQYLYWTKDIDFIIERGGYTLFYEIAQFWASRIERMPERNAYGLLDVMGPDEYHDHVNNSVYTNAIAAISLRIPEEIYANFPNVSETKLPKPDSNWTGMADAMYLPFDENLQYHLEYDEYKNGTQIKQADAVLLGYPLLWKMSETIRRNDLEIYELNTNPRGPCMTWAMHSIGWLDLSDEMRAFTNFRRNFQNIHGPFKVWTENSDGSGAANFITGVGGFLQNLLYGYLGLRVQSDRLDFNPRIIPNTTGSTSPADFHLRLDFEATLQYIAFFHQPCSSSCSMGNAAVNNAKWAIGPTIMTEKVDIVYKDTYSIPKWYLLLVCMTKGQGCPKTKIIGRRCLCNVFDNQYISHNQSVE